MNCTFWLLLTLVNCGNFAAETINYVVDVVTKKLSAIEETEVFMNFTPQLLFLSIYQKMFQLFVYQPYMIIA